ncbi:hypothetical protein [Streptomyces sp. WG-D5]
MYNNGTPAVSGAATGGFLASTGASVLWIVLASFAVIAVGAAILRIIPKRQQ